MRWCPVPFSACSDFAASAGSHIWMLGLRTEGPFSLVQWELEIKEHCAWCQFIKSLLMILSNPEPTGQTPWSWSTASRCSPTGSWAFPRCCTSPLRLPQAWSTWPRSTLCTEIWQPVTAWSAMAFWLRSETSACPGTSTAATTTG